MQRRSEYPSSDLSGPRTLVDLLSQRAADTGDKPVFTFLRPDGVEDGELTYQSLHQRAMAIAAELQARAAPGDRAVLLFPPGLDFICAFFGCMYAGIIAVPAPIPSRNRLTTAVAAIFQASRPALALSTADHEEQARQTYASHLGLANCPWFAVDRIPSDCGNSWRDPQVGGRHIAFLQYTSGSTSQPKGVMLSHDNLLYNASLVQEAFGTTPESRAVFWLPLYHDMGLIGGVIQPVYCGGSSTLMAPAAFLQRPALWLEVISRTRASISGGPDFAYDLCARKVPDEARSQLDLSCWRLSFVGAERIRPQTIDHFVRKFGGCGFRREAFFPCYGLAEATLMVSGGPHQEPPVVLNVHADALARNRARISHDEDATCRGLVGCGENLNGQRIVVVDPHTHVSLSEGNVGEIWVQGPSVADGYFENPQATATTFNARLADGRSDRPRNARLAGGRDGAWLRTGDLGFMHQNQLFVTGRLKNLIIIRGRNHYPEDIEQTINAAHAGLRAGHCAAFSIDLDGQEQLVVVLEVEPRHRGLDIDAAIQSIRAAIANRHELEVHAVALVKAGEVPRTSSGKTRRAACRDRFLRGELKIVAAWKAENLDQGAMSPDRGSPPPAPCSPPSAAEIESWLVERITARLRLAPGDVNVRTPFLELGMSSLDALEIAAALEGWLGRQLSPTAIYNHPTISSLAQWLASPLPAEEDVIESPKSSVTAPVELDADKLLAEVRAMSDRDIEGFFARELAKQ
jgi:acyl-CoA synthetase (AMP-forming)/AMP-acid ligase II/acyl carrier protein